MKARWADLWTVGGEVARGPFLFWGLILAAVKYNLDRLLAFLWNGERWSLLDFSRVVGYLWPKLPEYQTNGEMLAAVVLALLFMTVGVLLTLKRLRSVRLSPWLVLLFFVPVVKIFFFLLLAILPAREATPSRKRGGIKGCLGLIVPRTAAGSAAAGVMLSTAVATVCVWLGTTVLRSYGWALFVGLPFALGFLSVLVFGYHERRSFGRCLLVSLVATAAAGLALLLVAIEGMICLIMALPLAAPMALIGACLAYQIQGSDWWAGQSSRVFCVALLAPALLWLEHLQPAPLPLHAVRTSVVVDAPPERVWRHVVSFSELPPPKELMFRFGIAYPIRASIQGTGVGAVRHCKFSTGPFVEPIEVWDEPRLLKFSVTQNPAPMQEWTPYSDMHPPHLDGFLASQAGQFQLTPMPSGQTLLEGTTWYHHHLWPATYWRYWSDYIIHTIHGRVLRHVKQLAEST